MGKEQSSTERGLDVNKMIRDFVKTDNQLKILGSTNFTQDFEILKPRLERLKQVLAETKFGGSILLGDGTSKTEFIPNSVSLNIEEADWEKKIRQAIPEAIRGREIR